MVSERTTPTTSTGSSADGRPTGDDSTNHERKSTRGGTDSHIERRSVLKILGASAIPFVAGTAAAEGSGYGENGYGAAEYGGGQEETEAGDGGGEADDGGDDDGEEDQTEEPLENTILVDGIGASGESSYEIAVSGALERSRYLGSTINGDDGGVDGSSASGSVTNWRDAFRFSGDLEAITVDGPARVYVNGERLDPTEYGGDSAKTLTIVGNGVPSRYEVLVSGVIEAIEGEGATVTGEDGAEGTIDRDVHRYRLTGDLLEFAFLEGGTQVYLDSERIDPDG